MWTLKGYLMIKRICQPQGGVKRLQQNGAIYSDMLITTYNK